MHLYIASSWRNTYYPEVVQALRDAGHEVYDFRDPPSGDPGFHWTDVDSACADWSPEQYQTYLTHPLAERQFKNDIDAMSACDACVLVLPCGRSAHRSRLVCRAREESLCLHPGQRQLRTRTDVQTLHQSLHFFGRVDKNNKINRYDHR